VFRRSLYFQLIAVEILDVFSKSALQFIQSLEGRSSPHSCEDIRDVLAVSETVSFDAAFQCCPSSRQFAENWPHGLV